MAGQGGGHEALVLTQHCERKRVSATDPVFSVSSTAARTSEAISAGYRLEQPSPLALQCSVDSILSVEPGGSVRYIWTIGWTRQVEGGRLLFHGGALTGTLS